MHGKRIEHVIDPGPLRIPAGLRMGLLVMGIIGLAVFLGAAFFSSVENKQNVWAGFMVSFLFCWFLSMGGAAFLAIQYVTSAKWFVAIKRLPEALASYSYRGGVVFPLIALLGLAYVYPYIPSANYEAIWGAAGPDYPYEGTLKAFWLTPPMQVLRTLIYIVPVTILTFFLVKISAAPSAGPGSDQAKKRLRFSIVYLIVFGMSFSMYAWEMVLGVEPHWFSTMFGVYCFAGSFVSAMALMMIMLFSMREQTTHIQGRHLYDLGTLVMAFATFMVYIGFSQFMLIWYANIPEETFWYLNRYQGGWWVLTIGLAVLKWVIPFFVLMPPPMRTNRVAQTFVCICILVGQVADMYWVFYPAYYSELTLPSPVNILTFLGVFGFFGWSVLTHLSRTSMLPVEDAELISSVNGDYLHA